MALELTHHDDADVMAGDTWVIPFTLYDADGAALDLTDAELSWTFLNPDGYKCLDIINSAVIAKDNPLTSGKGRITVPAGATSRPPGRYSDAMRVVIGSEVDTMFHGMILVSADAFAQLPEELV
jgi:hypothetical protein